MKRLSAFCFSAILASMCLLTSAQAMPPNPVQHVARLTEKLNLTEEQQAVILEILEAAFGACEDRQSREEHKECMDSQREAVHAAIKAELTGEQQEKLAEQPQQDRQTCRRLRHRRRRPDQE